MHFAKAFLVASVVGFLLGAGQLEPGTAYADDQPALPDGGSIVTSTDGGRIAFADLGLRSEWMLSLECEGAQSTRYLLCASDTTSIVAGGVNHTCTAGPNNHLLSYDRGGEAIPVNFKPNKNRRYLSLYTDDAGIPFCKAQIIE